MGHGEDHWGGARPTRLSREASESPAVVRAQLAANAPLIRELADRLKRAPPPRCRDARPRQLRSRGHVRALPDRDPAGCDDGLGRAFGELGLRCGDRPARRALPGDLAIGPQPRHPRCRRKAAREAGALVVALVNDATSPLAAARRRDHTAAGRTRAQRRGDQVLHRRAERRRAAGGVLERRCEAQRGAGDAARSARARPGRSTGARRSRRCKAPRASTCSAAASASASPRKRR